MNLRRRRTWAVLAAAGALATVAVAFAGRSFYRAHMRYYTGADTGSLGCLSCHFDARGGTLADRLKRPRYRSPLELAVSPDGSLLYATASEGGSLLVVDVARRAVAAEIDIGSRPRGVALSADGRRAYVATEEAGSVAVVDLEARCVERTIAVGAAPAGLAIAGDPPALFAANALDDTISAIDLASGEETRRLLAGRNPCDLAPTPDGTRLLASNLLSFPHSRPEKPVSEVSLIDVGSRRVVRRFLFQNAHLLEGIAVAPEGDLALVTLVRPKNLLPAVQVSRGWMMTHGLGVIDLQTGRLLQLVLDEPRAFYADPYDVVVTPDGRLAFVSHSGADVVTAIDMRRLRELIAGASPEELATFANHLGLGRRFVRARIATGANPKGLAVSPDGKRVYVSERLADSIAIIDVERLAIAGSIDVATSDHETLLRRGEKVFNSARHTFQGQFSCRSCHPNNHVDGLQYDLEPDGLGLNILDNRTLLGLRGTAPFKWNGKNTSLYMQCGIRFAKFLTRVEPFAPRDLNALVAFLDSLPSPPSRHLEGRDRLTPAQHRGKAIFERTASRDGSTIAVGDRCITCHPPPTFTDRRKADVGSRSATDGGGEFDTPHLLGVRLSAPYLHDGRARTLEEIWTRFSPDDEHGITADLTKSELNDLIEYLKSL